jgi:hypothetical protein
MRQLVDVQQSFSSPFLVAGYDDRVRNKTYSMVLPLHGLSVE